MALGMVPVREGMAGFAEPTLLAVLAIILIPMIWPLI